MFKGNLALVESTQDFFPGMLGVGVKGEIGNNMPDPRILDDAEGIKATLERRIEIETCEEIEIVEGEKLLVNGRKLNFARGENGTIFTFLGKGGNAKEWELVDAEKREYRAMHSKGGELRGYVIEIPPALPKEPKPRKVKEPKPAKAPKSEKPAALPKPKPTWQPKAFVYSWLEIKLRF